MTCQEARLHSNSPHSPLSNLAHISEPKRGILIQKIKGLSQRNLEEFIESTKSPVTRVSSFPGAHRLMRSSRSSRLTLKVSAVAEVPIVTCHCQMFIETLPSLQLYGDSALACLTFYRSLQAPTWDQLYSRLSKETWEALVHLFYTCETEEKEPLLIFAANLILSMTPCEAESRIGKIIYAVDHLPKKIKKINRLQIIKKLNQIDTIFQDVIQNVRQRLNTIKLIRQKTGLEDPEEGYYVNLTKEFAELLFTKKGQINQALVEFLLIEFILKDHKPTNHQNALKRSGMYLHLQEIREKIQEIRTPLSGNPIASHLIRLNLNKDPDEPITELDAKKTALAAFLSHLRQGPAGSCFATSFAILLLNSHPLFCFNDFISLLKTGKLTRTIENVSRDFPFLLRMNNYHLNVEFFVNREGYIHNTTPPFHHLSEVPGVVAACRAVGITQIKETLNSIILGLFTERFSQQTKKISIHFLLKKITDYSILHQPPSSARRTSPYYLTSFAYESQMSNPLLKAWENSLAEMSEGKDESMIKPSIYYSITTSLRKRICVISPEISPEILSKFMGLIQERLQERIHLHYDPNIQLEEGNCLGENKGGFLIYDTEGRTTPFDWKRVDNPDSFQELVCSILLTCNSKFSFLPKLIKYVSTKDFIDDTLSYYCTDNEEVLARGGSWKQLEYTPWRTICGNVSQRVLEVYLERATPPPTITINSEDLTFFFERIIQFLKELPEEKKALFRKNPFECIPIYTPSHAFTLLAGNHSLVKAMDSELSPIAWLNNQVFPGKFLAEIPLIESATKEVMKKAHALIPSDKQREFDEKIQMIPTHLTVGGWYAEFFSIFQEATSLKGDKVRKRALQIQTFIYESLPTKTIQKLAEHSVHLADTNWAREQKDCHLGICIDLISQDLALMYILEDDSLIFPLEQPGMFRSEWQIPLNPYEGFSFKEK